MPTATATLNELLQRPQVTTTGNGESMNHTCFGEDSGLASCCNAGSEKRSEADEVVQCAASTFAPFIFALRVDSLGTVATCQACGEQLLWRASNCEGLGQSHADLPR